MRLSLVSLNAARRGAAFFVAVEANQSFTTIAERECRSAQIAELQRAGIGDGVGVVRLK
jgi:hypothetical protein